MPRSRLSIIGALVLAFALSACTTVAPPAPTAPATATTPAPAPAPPTPEQRSAAASTLAVERQWLASWFKGTPVVVLQRQDGSLTVDVPREFSFEPGRDALKPALAAVLDKVAESLRRVPIAEVRLIAAPADASTAANAGAALGLQRAVRIQEHLRGKGVAATRLAKPTASTGAATQLRIEATAPQ